MRKPYTDRGFPRLSGCVGWWMFAEGTGLFDRSGTGNAGTAEDDGTAATYSGGGIVLDDEHSQDVSVGTSNTINLTSTYTLAFALTPVDDGDGPYGIYSRYGAGSGPYLGWDNTSARMLAYDGSHTLYSANSSVADATFATFALVETGGNGQWYVNGAASGSAAAFTAPSKAATETLIGKDAVTYFNGTIYEVRAFNRALSAAEAKTLHNWMRHYA